MSERYGPDQSPDPEVPPVPPAPGTGAAAASPGPAVPPTPGENPSADPPPPHDGATTWIRPPAGADPVAPGAGEGAAGPWTAAGPSQPSDAPGSYWAPPAPPAPPGPHWGAPGGWNATEQTGQVGHWPPPGQYGAGGRWLPPGQPPPGQPPPGQWGAGGRWVPPGHWGGAPVWVPQQPSRPHPLRVLAVAVAVVLVAAVGVAIGRTSLGNGSALGSGNGSGNSGFSGNSGLGSNAAPSTNPTTPANSTVAAKVDPGIVDINTQLGYDGGEAAGTGMVLTSSGLVLTNNHVILGSTSISVTDVGNGQTYTATVVGEDESNDVAVIRLQGASGLKTVPLGDSSTVAVGNAVTAIGNAGGAGGTPAVAAGNVTALNQSITATDQTDVSSEQLSGLIQTDAPLQPGDSGGPLVDSGGHVIGMDTAASSGFQFQGGSSEGFSIPINQALSIAHQIIAGHSSSKVHIGSSALIGVRVTDGQSTAGAQVVEVEPGTPADGAGIVAGDVITSLGGQNVNSASGLSTLMASHHPGDKVQLVWVDDAGQQHSASVQLAVGPAT
jgi:S1-C subfamily serine protease